MVCLHQVVVATAEKLIELFSEVKAKPAGAERERFLADACGDDLPLKQQILSLLKAEADDGDSDFLKRSSPIRSAALVTEKPGDRIGRYKLLDQLGEGGCGVVYMAEQEEPVRRRVALKVIKLGMDTKSVIARFEAERQALALMDHQNIAKVHDAGATETGRPFFVMELVRGIKITDYCDQNNLTTDQRLELFTQVCHAVQHAHQKGIIHRDLKPSNILVTLHDGVPVPKVIDFGVAKATSDQRLTDKTVFTAFEQFIGTPAYMSPEQAELSGLDIDTRSDIYSLGVLLYELLTGRTPLDPEELLRSGMDEMRRKIRDAEPPRPSTRLSTMQAGDLTAIAKHRRADAPKLIHLVHGDLDWIVMKCLEKDRARRYETADGLALDLKRHLSNEPVSARPPSRAYQFQKLVRRNKLAFAAVSAVAVALMLGVVASSWQALRATRAERAQITLRQKAETNERKAAAEAAKSQQTARFLKDMLAGVGPSVALGRDTTMLREILDKTDQRIGTDLTNQPEVEFDLRYTLAQVYQNLESYQEMEANARKALSLARSHFGEETLQVANTLVQLSKALMYLRQLDEAEQTTRQAIALQKKLRGPGSIQEGSALINLGDVLRHQKKFADAEAALKEASALLRKHSNGENDHLAKLLYTLATLLAQEGKLDEAIAVQEEGLALRRKLHGEEFPNVGEDLAQLGSLLSQTTNRLDEAANTVRKGLEIMQRTQGVGKNYRQVWAEQRLARILVRQGNVEEAEIHLRAAVNIARSTAGTNGADMPIFLVDLASFLCRENKLTDAGTLIEEAIAFYQRNPARVRPGDSSLAALENLLTKLGDTNALQKLEVIRQASPKP